MLPENFDPHNCFDESLLILYFQSLGFTAEEAGPLAANWARGPQTDAEVREGVLAERIRRGEIDPESNQ